VHNIHSTNRSRGGHGVVAVLRGKWVDVGWHPTQWTMFYSRRRTVDRKPLDAFSTYTYPPCRGRM
jgi:hypothetical protein